MAQKKYFTVTELVELGWASQRTIYRYIKMRGFPAQRTGPSKRSSWRINLEAAEEWKRKKGLLT